MASTPAQNVAFSATVTMDELCAQIEDAERAHRQRAAADLARCFTLILLLAQQRDPRVTAATLSLSQAQDVDNGRLLRRATTTLAQLKEISEAKAKKLLRLSINLHQHGQGLLKELAAGNISADAVTEAAWQLSSIAPPHPKRDPEGNPWETGAYQRELERVETAKTQLGTALAETAGTAASEEDFRRQAKNLREQHHPKNAQQRHSDAKGARRISVQDCGDGMSAITGFIPTTQARAIGQKIAAAADAAHKKGQAAGRTRTQLEADLFIQSLLTGNAAGSATETASKSAHSVLLLLNLEDAIGLGACLAEDQLGYLEQKYPELHRQAIANREHYSQSAQERTSPHPPADEGVKPAARDLISGEDLDRATAAEYFHRAKFMRTVITDPISGYPLGLGRRYQPDQALKELIIARDQHCRHPGCQVPPRDCELNHTDPWAQGGATSYTNLELECRHHHTGLSSRWWSVTATPHSGDGTRTFTDAATGRHTTTQPQLPLDATAWADYRARLEQTDQPPF